MPSFTIKVPNGAEGEDLGKYESDYLPRAGDLFEFWHPRLHPDNQHPFRGIVLDVVHKGHSVRGSDKHQGFVTTTVWLGKGREAPTLYCDCRGERKAVDGKCENCGHVLLQDRTDLFAKLRSATQFHPKTGRDK